MTLNSCRFAVTFVIGLLAASTELTHALETKRVDVCVYGATPSGIVAAVTAKQEGCSALIMEPSRWVGGILGAGIKPMQDCGEDGRGSQLPPNHSSKDYKKQHPDWQRVLNAELQKTER